MDFPFERQNERTEIKVCVIKWKLTDLEIEITVVVIVMLKTLSKPSLIQFLLDNCLFNKVFVGKLPQILILN